MLSCPPPLRVSRRENPLFDILICDRRNDGDLGRCYDAGIPSTAGNGVPGSPREPALPARRNSVTAPPSNQLRCRYPVPP